MNTIEITCPNCGKQHNIIPIHYNGVYLSGMPKISMRDFTSMMKICKCGFLVTARKRDIEKAIERFQSDAYTTALHATYDTEEEYKLALLEALYDFPQMEMYRAQLFTENGNDTKRHAALEAAIARIETRQDVQIYRINGEAMHGVSDTLDLVLTPQRRLIDLYRQKGDFAAAKSQLKQLRKKPYEIGWDEYMRAESNLIRSQNSEMI